MQDRDATTTDLASLEKQRAGTVDLGGRRWLLAALIALYVLALTLPFAGDTAGWRVLTFTESDTFDVAIGERVFAVLSFVCLPVFTLLLVIMRRTVFALFAWMAGCVSLVAALLGLWLRQTGSTGAATGAGMYLAIACVLVAVPFLTAAWTRRDPEQQEMEALRREQTEFNPVAEAQAAAGHQSVRRAEDAGTLIDDRRARAAQRHRRARGDESAGPGPAAGV